ncbi:flavin reductase [Sulfurovum sp. zt1-1]|uniref:Flavin reductase n=1 Tax=Sulfurovum zhangzhouensis TaxID=3019067 RepID=A0ABT7QVP4_9BACT|nr:flavin reductase [Sulfurovum zhangzhouensis]MDM5270917.1 flavin reductase [Sulfurovum zhangzhouensis]
MRIARSPFRYAVTVRGENHTHSMLEEHSSFTLNFLPFSWMETVDMTGRLDGNTDDKLSQSDLEIEGKDKYGNILLSTSDFIYECKVCDTYRNGDHTLFITDVSNICVNKV